MKVKIESKIFLPDTSKDIESLTSGAIVNVEKIEYDLSNKTVKIPLRRMKLTFGKTMLSGKSKPIYNSQTWIESILVIREITDFKIINGYKNDEKEFTVLFGVLIEPDKIYLSSAEELEGDQLYVIKISINEIDVEFRDI